MPVQFVSTRSFRQWTRISLLLLLGLFVAAIPRTNTPHVQAQVGHIANRAYGLEQVMRVIGTINHANGAPHQHSSVAVHQGYVIQVYSSGTLDPKSGIAVYDLSDPTSPRLVSHTEANHLAEQHAIALTQLEGHTYSAHLAVDGISIWDWTDMTTPRPVSHLRLPGIHPGYSHGAWWLAWQAPYLYVSGASNGIYIVDTTDPTQPRLLDREGKPNPLPTSQTGGFRVGSIFAVGNLLVASANDGRGYATLDISDPRNPTLLTARVSDAPSSYSSMLNGNRLYAAGTDNLLHAFDLNDPHQLRYLGSVALEGRGGYLTIQDDFAHVGASSHYMKVDISQPNDLRTLSSASSNNSDSDEDFVVAVGNLVVISDDHDNGSFIAPHQAEADTTGPVVNMVNPPVGAINQSRATRIGLTFTDLIDLNSVNKETLIVRPLDGDTPGDALSGSYSTQTGIINFTPDKPLEPGTSYEIVVPADGIRDVMGNPNPTTFRTTFSTGTTLGKSFWCAIEPPTAVAVGQPLDFRLFVSEDPGQSIVRWDYGDHSPISEVALAPIHSHTYNAPGRYSVRATVDADGSSGDEVTACTTRATVYAPITSGQPQNSSTIILDHSGTQVWNVNPDNDSVTAIDAVRLQKMGEISVGRQPRTLAQAPDGTIWAVNQADATISVIDAANRVVLSTIPLPIGSEPYGIVFSSRRASAYVSLQSTGQLAEVDVTSRTLNRTLDVGATPRALALSADGERLFITRFISAAQADQAHGEVTEVDPLAWQVRQVIPLAYDPGPDTEASSRGVPNGLAAAAISPAGDRLWIGARKANTARGAQRDGQPLTFESTVRSILATINLTTNQEDIVNRYDFNDRDGPVALRFSPLGDYLFALLEGSNAVDIIDTYTHQLVTSIDDLGHAPQGLVFTSDGNKLFIHSWLTRSVLVYDVSRLFSRDAIAPQRLAEISTVANDQVPPRVLQGKQVFYNAADPRMSRDGYMACASCHYDSRDDGQIWDRTDAGEGLRNTVSLLGKGSPEHGAFHWSANFDEIQDFEHDIRTNFGGTGFLPEEIFNEGTRNHPLGDAKTNLSAELDALAAYVDSLRTLPPSPYRNPDGSLTPDGEAGRTIFIAAGCVSCHNGPQFTDSSTGQLHHVGTLTTTSGLRLGGPLRGLDTPTLRGLWLSAPYLHDGSAPTLADVFVNRNPLGLYGDLHSFLETNPRAIEQLVAYLLQIDDREPAFDPLSPAIEIFTPAEGTSIRAGETLTITVNIRAFMGPASHVEFYANDLLLGEARGPLYTFAWTPNTPGNYEIVAHLVYESGAATSSAPRRLEIMP